MEKYYNLKEGYLSKLNDNNETLISAVTTNIDENHKTIQKEDKQNFEDFKNQYKGIIDIKCNQEYGKVEDKELWEDCAKELFLTSKNYLLQGDEYKAAKLETKIESKKLKENNVNDEYDNIQTGDKFINKNGAQITVLELSKDGKQQFVVTNTTTGKKGDVLTTSNIVDLLKINGYHKITESISDRYQLRKFPNEDEFKETWGLYDLKQDKFIQKGSKYIMQAALEDKTNKQLEESKIDDIIANKGILSEIKKFDDKIIKDSFLNMSELQQIPEKNQIQVLQECRRLSGKEPLTESEDNEYQYMLLNRLKTDCEYFLGNGNRNEKHLWAGSVEAQINEMKKIWNNLKEKPEWLTIEDINNYEKLMKNENANLNVKFTAVNESVDDDCDNLLSVRDKEKIIAGNKKTESMIDNYTLSQIRNVIDSEGNEFTLKISNRNTSNETKYLNIDREDLKNIYISLAGNDNDLIKLPSQENSEETKAFIQNQLDKSYKLNEDQYENERRKGRPSIDKIAEEEYYDNEKWYKQHIKDYKNLQDFIEQEGKEIASEYNLSAKAMNMVCQKVYNLATNN